MIDSIRSIKTSKLFVYSAISVVLAIIFLLVLTYFQYFIHELGHANTAVIYAFTQKSQNVSMNFTYVNYPIIHSLKVPQQTIAVMPRIMMSYGVLFTMVYYVFIFLLISRIKIIQNNKLLEYPLIISLFTLVIQDIISNLVCGTDGLQLSCSSFLINSLSILFSSLIITSLGFFFAILFISIEYDKFHKHGL